MNSQGLRQQLAKSLTIHIAKLCKTQRHNESPPREIEEPFLMCRTTEM